MILLKSVNTATLAQPMADEFISRPRKERWSHYFVYLAVCFPKASFFITNIVQWFFPKIMLQMNIREWPQCCVGGTAALYLWLEAVSVSGLYNMWT